MIVCCLLVDLILNFSDFKKFLVSSDPGLSMFTERQLLIFFLRDSIILVRPCFISNSVYLFLVRGDGDDLLGFRDRVYLLPLFFSDLILDGRLRGLIEGLILVRRLLFNLISLILSQNVFIELRIRLTLLRGFQSDLFLRLWTIILMFRRRRYLYKIFFWTCVLPYDRFDNSLES